MKNWTLSQIKKSLKEVSDKGWVKSRRIHDTGIGQTLEHCLGLDENNIALPDFGKMELKSQRINTSSMLTLFTKSPEGISNAEIRERFGYPDKEYPKIKIVHQTITNGKDNGRWFGCEVDELEGKLRVKRKGEHIGYYDLNFLKQKAIEKIGNGLILVLAETKKEKGHEYFHYIEAYLLKDLDPVRFLEHSKYDIRLGVYHSGEKAGQQHDHGSAFRLTEKSIPELFKIKTKIL